MRTRSVVVGIAAVLAALLGACGGDPGDAEPTPSPSTEAPGTPTPSPPATAPTLPSRPPVSPPPAPPPTERSGQTTLTGSVYEGVEAGCRLLQTGSGDYLLIGEAAESAQIGSTVTVRGQIRADLATTCQQGTPFEVSEVLD